MSKAPDSLFGVEPATQELINSISDKGRTIRYVQPGTDEHRYFEMFGIEANAGGPELKDILLRENPSKPALLEEFVHGIQVDVGMEQSSENLSWREYHAKDFLVRHKDMMGIGAEDVQLLEHLRDRELKNPTTRELRDEWVARRQHSAELNASRGMGVASLAVDIAEGNYTAAAIDTASMAADTKLGAEVAETAVKSAGGLLSKLSPKLAFNAIVQGAKRTPLLGAGITLGITAYSSSAHAWNGDYDLAAAELAAGGAEAAGNMIGFGMGDAAREVARQGLIAAGGDRMAQIDKSGIRQLGESVYAVGSEAVEHLTAPASKPVSEILPLSHASMAQGADMMGERGEVSRIAIERTGIAANDPANNMALLSQEAGRPRSHLLVLQDGSIQGPESGGVAFGNNPQIAAGKNGGTLGIMYAGTGAMNDAQWQTTQQVQEWLSTQRQSEGLSGSVEMIAGSTTTAELLNLPTPRGPLPTASDPQVSMAPVQSRMRINNSM